MRHSMDVEVACKYGMAAAHILEHIQFWVLENKANERNFRDGRYWTYNSVKAYARIFPYLSEKVIRNSLNKLVDEGILLKGNYNEDVLDRTLWYTFTDYGCELFEIGKFCNDVPEGQMGENSDFTQKDKSEVDLSQKGKSAENPILPEGQIVINSDFTQRANAKTSDFTLRDKCLNIYNNNTLNTHITNINKQERKKDSPNKDSEDEDSIYREAVGIVEQNTGSVVGVLQSVKIVNAVDKLQKNIELFRYIVEYCCKNDKTRLAYICKICEDWANRGINSVELAELYLENYKSACDVLNCAGLYGRMPVRNELVMVSKWRNEYGFEMNMILDAVTRTLNQKARPDFAYTEGILKSWMSKGIKTIEDAKKSDEEHKQEQSKRETVKKDSFHNFEEHTYDYDELERRFVKNVKYD